MKVLELKDFKGGWFIGDFEPSIVRTIFFEVGVLCHRKGESWPIHYHTEVTEYNYLVSGSMLIQDKMLKAGNLFILEPWEIANPVFLEDCVVLVVKIPSVPGDKTVLREA